MAGGPTCTSGSAWSRTGSSRCIRAPAPGSFASGSQCGSKLTNTKPAQVSTFTSASASPRPHVRAAGPVVTVQDADHAVELPGPAVEAALQLRRRAAAFRQPPPAVLADVVVRADVLRRLAHHDDRFVVDVVGDVVADVRNFLQAAGQLPHLAATALSSRARKSARCSARPGRNRRGLWASRRRPRCLLFASVSDMNGVLKYKHAGAVSMRRNP